MRGCHPCVHLFFSVCNKLILRFNDDLHRYPRTLFSGSATGATLNPDRTRRFGNWKPRGRTHGPRDPAPGEGGWLDRHPGRR